jgi:hypothetical protein
MNVYVNIFENNNVAMRFFFLLYFNGIHMRIYAWSLQ